MKYRTLTMERGNCPEGYHCVSGLAWRIHTVLNRVSNVRNTILFDPPPVTFVVSRVVSDNYTSSINYIVTCSF